MFLFFLYSSQRGDEGRECLPLQVSTRLSALLKGVFNLAALLVLSQEEV